MSRLVCNFILFGARNSAEVDSIVDVANGFWVSVKRSGGYVEYKLTKGSDNKYWVPPSQILYIENVKEVL